MIDDNCVIWKQGKGFCWCPSSAWGLRDEELCQLCQIKNAEIIVSSNCYWFSFINGVCCEKPIGSSSL